MSEITIIKWNAPNYMWVVWFFSKEVEGQPYARLPVFRIEPVEGEGKVKVVNQNLLLLFGNNVEDSENEESWQNVNGLSDCIQAVSDDVEAKTQVVSTDPKPKGKGDAICVQCLQTVYELSNWVNTIRRWAKSLFWHQ